MPITAEMLESDVAAVEANEVNIGSVVTVTLADGQSTVTALRKGSSNALNMMIAGYADQRSDELSVRRSQFTAIPVEVPKAKDTFLINGQSWLIELVTGDEPNEESSYPGSPIIYFTIKQNW